jgi:hypothetical protein
MTSILVRADGRTVGARQSRSAKSREAIVMPQVIGVAAVVGAVFLLGNAAAWRPAGSTVAPVVAQIPQDAAETARTVPRCGGKVASARPATRAPLPNAYMLANGRLFALADVFACVNRLHTARLS